MSEKTTKSAYAETQRINILLHVLSISDHNGFPNKDSPGKLNFIRGAGFN